MDYKELSHHVIGKEKVDKSILFTPQNSKADLLFESIQMPHWSAFLSIEDVQGLYKIATSASLAGNFDKKKAAIFNILEPRGFKFFAGGTNRMIFRHLEFPSIVAKVAMDRVGLGDNTAELYNQRRIWPYCAKMIQVVPSGVLGFAERVEPILNRYEFNAHALSIYMLTLQIIGKYVLEDVGEEYFKNFGVRPGFGPVLVDYPYIFELDDRKLICMQHLGDGTICLGEIDYDDGFNHLYCKKCGRMYNAAELQKSINREEITIHNKKGGQRPMKARLMKGNSVLSSNYSSDVIVPQEKVVPAAPKGTQIVASLKKGNTVLDSNYSATDTVTHTFTIGGRTAKIDIPKVQPKSEAENTKKSVPEASDAHQEHSMNHNIDSAIDAFNENFNKMAEEVEPPKEEPVVPASMMASIPKPTVETVTAVPVEEKSNEEQIAEAQEKNEVLLNQAIESTEELNVPKEVIDKVNNVLIPEEDQYEKENFPKSPWNEEKPPIVVHKKRIITDTNVNEETV